MIFENDESKDEFLSESEFIEDEVGEDDEINEDLTFLDSDPFDDITVEFEEDNDSDIELKEFINRLEKSFPEGNSEECGDIDCSSDDNLEENYFDDILKEDFLEDKQEIFDNLVSKTFGNQIETRVSRSHFILNHKNPKNSGKEVIFKLISDKDFPISQLVSDMKRYNDNEVSVFWVLDVNEFHNYEFFLQIDRTRRYAHVSMLEWFIQKTYQGRVYLCDLDRGILFACHFSLPDNRKDHCIKKIGKRKKKQYYFIRIANPYRIKSYNLLLKSCYINDFRYLSEHWAYNIARLFDMRLDRELSGSIGIVIREKKCLRTKILINSILERFKSEFGKFSILSSIELSLDPNSCSKYSKILKLAEKLKFSKKMKFKILFPRIRYRRRKMKVSKSSKLKTKYQSVMIPRRF